MRIRVLEDRRLVIAEGVQKWWVTNNKPGYEMALTNGESQITIIRTYLISDVDLVVVYSEFNGFNYVEQRCARKINEEFAVNAMLESIENRIGHEL